MTINEFFDKLDSGATWSAGVSFKRANPLPLDRYSVFKSNEDAEKYASSNPVAYPGQILAVVSETEPSNVYFINEQMVLEKIGIIPTGEPGAINVDEKGTITLNGFSQAENLSIPQKSQDGTLQWVSIEDIKSDTNTITNGDSLSIDTLLGEDNNLIASLHGFSEASSNWVPYKNGTQLAWKEEYKFDDSKITQDITALQTKDTEIESALSDRPTNSEIDSKVQEAVTKAGHLKRVILESKDLLPPVAEADELTIYMVLKPTPSLLVEEVEPSDTYLEYMAINGKWEIIGDTAVNLADYVTKQELETKSEALNANISKVETTADNALPKSDFSTFQQENAQSLQSLTESKMDISVANSTFATQEAVNGKLDASEISKYQTIENANADKEALTQIINTKASKKDLDKADNKINALQETLNGKVDAVEGQRLITEEESTKLNTISTIDGQVIFEGIVLAENITGLETWTKTNRDTTPGLISNEKESKLDNIAEGAQVNILESIKVEGSQEALVISEKSVTLPAATAEKIGLVKLSSEVGTDSQGALEVKSLNVNKLSQTENEDLILDGGNAKK